MGQGQPKVVLNTAKLCGTSHKFSVLQLHYCRYYASSIIHFPTPYPLELLTPKVLTSLTAYRQPLK